ncbi:MAG: AraC family transcriptional regulator [Methylacidiphilales bacterium]|nr:AraC family transcriptional regulator [Candidatus Methylacidiphilales bacterium]
MQKRLSHPHRIVHAPISLSADFPIVGGDLFQQGDRPITWLHGHNCLELGYCYDGAGTFVIGSKVLSFRTGDVSVITPAEVHLAQSVPGTSSRWTWIYLDPSRLVRLVGSESSLLATGGLTGARFRNLVSAQRDPFLGPLVRELAAELNKKNRGYQVVVRGLVASLMVRLQRLARFRSGPRESGIEPAIRRVAPALDLIAQHYAHKADIRLWARQCHLSVTHFRRVFDRALGKSPLRYLIELRVLMAASRLQTTNEKIIDIAHDTGFTTLSSFNRSFRRTMKVTPRQWRVRR